jgi:hypothetical protein
VGIVLIGFVVSRLTGARAQFLDDFPLEPGECVLWEDLTADAYPVPTHTALLISYRRARRGAVRVTNRRILSGSKMLLSSRHMIVHILHPSDRVLPDEANDVGGGLLTRGYQILVFERASMVAHIAERAPFVELCLDSTRASSLNLSRYRIYTDSIAMFCLPD